MRVRIDTDKCIANGACVRAAPQVFSQDDDGIVFLLDENPRDDQREDVEQAAILCPAYVIESE